MVYYDIRMQWFWSTSVSTEERLHTKLGLDFFSWPKTIYVWTFFYNKNDLDWCSHYLRYFRPKCAERCRRLGRSSRLPQAIFRIVGFHAKNSTDSTSVSVQHWPKYLPYWCVVIWIFTINIIRNVWFDFIHWFCCSEPVRPITMDATVTTKAS